MALKSLLLNLKQNKKGLFMKKYFLLFTILGIFLLNSNVCLANDSLISYDPTYRLERELKKIDYDIRYKEKQIRKIRYSSSLSSDEKRIKIRRLQREISNKEREQRRIKAKCRRIIS